MASLFLSRLLKILSFKMRDLSGIKFGSLGRWISGNAFIEKEDGRYRDGVVLIAEYEVPKKIMLSGFLQFNTKEDSQAAVNAVSPDKFIVWKKTRFALVNYIDIGPLAADVRLFSHGEPSKKMLKFLGVKPYSLPLRFYK